MKFTNNNLNCFLKDTNNKNFVLAKVNKNGNVLIYVDDFYSWCKDTNYGKYEEVENTEYNTKVFILENNNIYVDDYYLMKSNSNDEIPALKDYFNEENMLYIGSDLSSLFDFIEKLEDTSCLYISLDYFSKDILNRDDLKLCYIKDNIAYFTDNEEQWGDDWDDSPYEYNAGPPYNEEGFDLLNIGFYVNAKYLEPYESFHNKYLSVEEINAKLVPWLIPNNIECEQIFAGESLKDFVKKIKSISGEILCCVKLNKK